MKFPSGPESRNPSGLGPAQLLESCKCRVVKVSRAGCYAWRLRPEAARARQDQALGVEVADCWDNAVAESFFATFKIELVYQSHWQTRREARTAIFEYLELFYNRRRRHSWLNYISPVDFEQPNQQLFAA